MSYMTFATRNDEVRLAGFEVQHISWLAEQAGLDELVHDEYRSLRRALGIDPWHDQRQRLSWLMTGRPTPVLGSKVCLLSVSFDLLVATQPEAVVLVWLYTECSRFGWIPGEHRPALADRIQQAVDAGLARPDVARLTGSDQVGWEEVVEFLRADTSEPVVTSVTVGPSFPSRELAMNVGTWTPPLRDEGTGDVDDDAWYDLDNATQWDACMRALLANDDLRWTPEVSRRYSNFTLDWLRNASDEWERFASPAL